MSSRCAYAKGSDVLYVRILTAANVLLMFCDWKRARASANVTNCLTCFGTAAAAQKKKVHI